MQNDNLYVQNRPVRSKDDRIRAYKQVTEGVAYPIPTVSELDNIGFFTAPASTKYHGCYEGGLFDHSYNVTIALRDLTQKLGLIWERDDSPYIVGLFHDLCKCDNYRKIDNVVPTRFPGYCYAEETLFKGHGIKSVLILSQYLRLTEEEVACIVYHMGAFTDKEEWQDYTNAIHRYPNVLYTHTADMIAAHIIESDPVVKAPLTNLLKGDRQ